MTLPLTSPASSAPPAAVAATLDPQTPTCALDPQAQDIAGHVRALREAFRTGATKPLATRRALLLQLQHMLEDGECALRDAVWQDLHKNAPLFRLTEVLRLRNEIQLYLDSLEEWTTPEIVPTNESNLPGISTIRREPLGVVCIIGTWNFPVAVTFRPVISALAAGNCVLVRLPADDTTQHVNRVLIQLLQTHMDARYVRFVYGGRPETERMLQERFDLIFATGSATFGKAIARAAAEHLTPVVLELGGKNPAIVDKTADLAHTARRLTFGAFLNAGQLCIRPDYVLVDESVGDALVALIRQEMRNTFGEDPQRSPNFGRMINAQAFDRVADLLDRDAAFVVGPCSSSSICAEDKYIAPTLLNFKQDRAAFRASAGMTQEIFGPLLPICYYDPDDLDGVLADLALQDKPLAIYLFSNDPATKSRVIDETSSGSMAINDVIMQTANPQLPFGGVGLSGMGAYHGRHGFEAFSHRKAILDKPSP